MNRIPLYDATAPIVCTAASSEVDNRLRLIEHLRSRLLDVTRTPDGLLLRFPDEPALEQAVRRFALDEKACCRFWGFAVEVNDGELTLRWDAPPALADTMDHLHEALVGDEPLTAASGLF